MICETTTTQVKYSGDDWDFSFSAIKQTRDLNCELITTARDIRGYEIKACIKDKANFKVVDTIEIIEGGVMPAGGTAKNEDWENGNLFILFDKTNTVIDAGTYYLEIQFTNDAITKTVKSLEFEVQTGVIS